MKVGFIGLNDLTGVEEDAKFAAKHALEGIEYNYWHHPRRSSFDHDIDAEKVARKRAILDEHGVRAASFGLWGSNHIAPDPVERQESLARLDKAIEYARNLGAEILITGGGQIPNGSLEENVAEFVKVFPPYLEKAQQAGLKVALYAVHGNSFFNSIEAYERVWEYIPDVGIKLDPANIMHHGEAYIYPSCATMVIACSTYTSRSTCIWTVSWRRNPRPAWATFSGARSWRSCTSTTTTVISSLSPTARSGASQRYEKR